MNMKTFALLLSLSTLSVHSNAQAQTTGATVATIPAGYLSLTLPPAASVNNPTCSAVSIPFYNASLFTGPISSVDSSQAFSCANAAWTVNQFVTVPSFAHFISGSSVGRSFLITANTATQLTVSAQGADDTTPYNLATLLSAGDTFEVVPANTLGSLFGITGGPFLTGKTAMTADNVYLWNVANQTWNVYFNNGSHWRSASSLLNQDNVIIYPEEGLYIVHSDTVHPLTLAFMGVVPSTNERTDVPGAASSCISYRFPVASTIGALSLENLPGWQSGKTATTADDVYLWNSAANTWDVCFYNGTHWRNAASILNVDSTEIVPAGAALFVIRQSVAPSAGFTLVQTLPYTLN